MRCIDDLLQADGGFHKSNIRVLFTLEEWMY